MARVSFLSDHQAWELTTYEKKMEKILYNLALIDTTQFCIKNNIDCSGTHLIKIARKFQYTLVKSDTKKPVVSVTFFKSSIPTHIIY